MAEKKNEFLVREISGGGKYVVAGHVDSISMGGSRPAETPLPHWNVTTRAEVPDLGRDPLSVDMLPADQATDLLLDRAGRGDDEREVAADLAGTLGYLPLALEQAGAPHGSCSRERGFSCVLARRCGFAGSRSDRPHPLARLAVDRQLVNDLLAGVRKLPKNAPIRVAVESRWAADKEHKTKKSLFLPRTPDVLS